MFSSFFSSSKKRLGGQQVHQRCKFFNSLIRGSKRVNNYHFSGFYQRENLSTYHKIIMMTSFQTKTFYVSTSRFILKTFFPNSFGKLSYLYNICNTFFDEKLIKNVMEGKMKMKPNIPRFIIGFADLFSIRKIFCKKRFNNPLVSLFSNCVSILLRV